MIGREYEHTVKYAEIGYFVLFHRFTYYLHIGLVRDWRHTTIAEWCILISVDLICMRITLENVHSEYSAKAL